MKNKQILSITIIILIIDRISKLLISNLMITGQSIKLINKVLYLTHVKNKGVAFSFLEGKIALIIIMTIIVICFIIKYIHNKKLSKLEKMSYGLILGGAIGNLIDRIFYGYVIDFIDVYIFKYDYPIFNIADISIVVGIIIILIITLKEESSDEFENSIRIKRKNR